MRMMVSGHLKLLLLLLLGTAAAETYVWTGPNTNLFVRLFLGTEANFFSVVAH